MMVKMKQWYISFGGVMKVPCLDEIYEGMYDCLTGQGKALLTILGKS